MPTLYRETLPSGKYDLLIVSLVHQGPDMLHYIANNLEKYVKGSFLWIAHYNGPDHDENTLPPWAWLVRDTHATSPWRRSISFGVIKALTFALENGVQFTNVLTLSSGSAFYREFQVPTRPLVCLDTYERQIDPTADLSHVEAIHVAHLGKCANYLTSIGSIGWQYQLGGDSDTEFHNLILARGFKYIRGNQFSGQMWPYEVAVMLEKDIKTLYNSHVTTYYVTEEIYFSTYAYNYAKLNNIPVGSSVVMINWAKGYAVDSVERITSLREDPRFNGPSGPSGSSGPSGPSVPYAACKLSDNLSDPVRVFINKA